MRYIDPHIHCVSRTTDDYQYMARCGVVAVSEPAFWAGYDRSTASSFADYFRHLMEIEPKRAARYGIDHYCWLCINAKEAENVELSRDVIKLIPPLLDHPLVLGVGDLVARVLVQPDLADAEHARVVEQRGDELDHLARQLDVLGFLGVDAEPAVVVDAVLRGALRLEVGELLEVGREGLGRPVVARPERRLRDQPAAGERQVLVIVRRARAHMGMDLEVLHGYCPRPSVRG